MTNTNSIIVHKLLELKAKAARGEPWVADDSATVRRCMENGGEMALLASCCILTSNQSAQRAESLRILRKALVRGHPSAYAELSIHEALACVAGHDLDPLIEPAVKFISRSL